MEIGLLMDQVEDAGVGLPVHPSAAGCSRPVAASPRCSRGSATACIPWWTAAPSAPDRRRLAEQRLHQHRRHFRRRPRV